MTVTLKEAAFNVKAPQMERDAEERVEKFASGVTRQYSLLA